ncbi:FKBP-type peptidyl-prolyl cis-trans isomerase [Rhizorhabdus phycosphaerae]|uniref:FKBP-type peptidyl-prolyl cis-trans isomerase n=1 Tax=Rhizorhabdus phycosphaerae TaxID=2711156 RepID=UPI0013EC3FC3|nr:FKBP-type peptidyl-prolyl cis-trans isomerase [Rhizorhabdus phycosphaerae]
MRFAKHLIALAIIGASAGVSVEARTLAGGTQVEDIVVGKGPEAVAGRSVTVHYTGWLYRGGKRSTKFDSSVGSEPFTFFLGAGEVIKGWDDGVVGMKVGGKRTLILPPAVAYGSEGDETIPPNSWLIFDIQLLKVE